jgi:hypothetical protein
MAQKRDRFEWLESRWSILDRVWTIPVIGGALGWALAAFTHFMQQWAPFSWFVGIAFGALAAQGWKLLRSVQREKDEQRRRLEMLQAPKSTVNPLDTEFRNQRIYLTDIVPPFGFIVEGKEFRGCEIIGPANIAIMGCEISHSSFISCDGVVGDGDAWGENVILLKDCRIRESTLYKLTIIVPWSSVQRPPIGGIPYQCVRGV